MNLTTGRAQVRYYLRSGGSSSAYSDAEIDDAIQTVFDEFVRITKCTKRVDTVSLTAAALGVLPTMPTGFRPDRLISAYLTGTNVVSGVGNVMPNPIYSEGRRDGNGPPYSATLEHISYNQLIDMKYAGSITAQPAFIAFSSGVVDTSVGEVFPAPGDTYTLNLLWWKAFATGDTTWIIADDLCRQILSRGVPAFMQLREPENMSWAKGEWVAYQQWAQTVSPTGSLGAQTVISSRRRR